MTRTWDEVTKARRWHLFGRLPELISQQQTRFGESITIEEPPPASPPLVWPDEGDLIRFSPYASGEDPRVGVCHCYEAWTPGRGVPMGAPVRIRMSPFPPAVVGGDYMFVWPSTTRGLEDRIARIEAAIGLPEWVPR